MTATSTTLLRLLTFLMVIGVSLSVSQSSQAQTWLNNCNISDPYDGEPVVATSQAFLDGWSCGSAVRYLEVSGPDITSLAGLSGLSQVENLTITGTSLTSLDGLQGLSGTDAWLIVTDNPLLASLSGLENMARVGSDLIIARNAVLPSLDGLEGLTMVGGGNFFAIEDNASLESCSCGLKGLIAGDPPAFAGVSTANFIVTGNAPAGQCQSAQQILDNPCPVPPQPSVDIYRYDVRTGDVARVTFDMTTNEYSPSLSPDGNTMAYHLVGDDGINNVYLMDLTTGVSTPLAGGEGGSHAEFSNNGKQIAFDRSRVGDFSVYVVPANGGTPALVRENAFQPSWNNNSKRLAFTDRTDLSLRTIDVKSKDETTVAARGFEPSWSPNGKSIAFSVDFKIHTVAVKQNGEPKGSPVNLGGDFGFGSANPSWSNNGKDIVYSAFREGANSDRDLFSVSASGGDRVAVTGVVGSNDGTPAYSNNGRYIYYSALTQPSLGKGAAAAFAVAEGVQPEQIALDQNYPNPFNPSTAIGFSLPADTHVRLTIYDVMGREVSRLVDGPMQAGAHRVTWNAASGLSSGTYLYRLQAGAVVQTRVMSLIK